LLAFYRRLRSLGRALLAACHVPESAPAAANHWRDRTAWYLRAAAQAG
jgi:hypothetical protein